MVFSQKLTSRYGDLKHLAGHSILLMQVGAFMQVMKMPGSHPVLPV